MNPKTRLLLALFAAVLSAGSLVAAYYFTFRPVKVVVATKDFMPGDAITPDGVQMKTISIGDASPGAVTNAQAIIGKTVGLPVLTGQQIVARVFSTADTGPDRTLIVVKNPVSPLLSVGQKVSVVVILQEGPMTLGSVEVYSVQRGDEMTYLLSIPQAEAARFAYALSTARQVYLFPEKPGQ